MAIVIESTTEQSTYANVTDVGSSGTFTVSKPTGLAVGDMLLVYFSTTFSAAADPTGWTSTTLDVDASVVGTPQYFSWKVADASDVAGSGWTFTTSADNTQYIYICYRVSGTRTSLTPVIDSAGSVENQLTTDTVNVSFNPLMTIPSGTLLIYLIGTDYNVNNTVDPLTNYSVTGATGSFTERLNDAASSDEYSVVADTITSTDGTLTAATFDTAAAPSSSTVAWYFNVLAIYPQQDANENLTLTETTQASFAPTGTAGTHATLTVSETSNKAFAPVGYSNKPTQWNNISKPTTTWANTSKD